MARLYLRCDFFIGHEYRGMIASCPNEGEDFYRVPYTPESLEELKDLRIECSYARYDHACKKCKGRMKVWHGRA